LTLILLTNYENIFSETNRLSANAAFNSISFGHFGVSGVLLAMHFYKTGKIFAIYTFFLSLFFMLQAGSRGPLLTFILLILFIFIASKRNVKSLMYLLGFIGILVVALGTYLASVFSQLAPVLYNRVFFQTFDGEEDGREPLLMEALNTFLQNPILGGKFAINLNGLTLYSHNLITDALMALGIFGGLSIIYLLIKTVKIAFQSSGRPEFILNQLLLQQILFLMLSSAIYLNPLVNILWILPFIKPNKFVNN
jgi:hypothetical protein